MLHNGVRGGWPLRRKYRESSVKRQKGGHNQSGQAMPKVPGVPQTRFTEATMILLPSGKITWKRVTKEIGAR